MIHTLRAREGRRLAPAASARIWRRGRTTGTVSEFVGIALVGLYIFMQTGAEGKEEDS